MLDIATKKEELILENLDFLDQKIEEIRDETIVLFLRNFIGKSGCCYNANSFSLITGISPATIYKVVDRQTRLGIQQKRRWCFCILHNWTKIVRDLERYSRANNIEFAVDNFKRDFEAAFDVEYLLAVKLKEMGVLDRVILNYQTRTRKR